VKWNRCLCLLFVFAWMTCASAQRVSDPAMLQSLYTQRPQDPLAIVANASMHVVGDGMADDTNALQAAIDKVADTTGSGLVFLPEGRYRVSHTLHLWSGIRLIGYGAKRPVLVLAANTPGYQSGHEFLGTGRYMLQFASRKPAPGGEVVDANEFTFYSGLSNVDFEVGDNNPAAICVRFHVAQHSFLSHVKFRVGYGRAALEDVGNQADTLEIDGGDYGIISVRTSPAWQFLLMDSHMKGQRKAAIHTQEVGMTLVRDTIEDTPIAVEIPADMPEQLYVRDVLLRNITRTAVVLGDTTSQHHQVTLDHVLCSHVAKMLEATHNNVSGFDGIVAKSSFFIEKRLTVGQEINTDGREGAIALRHSETSLKQEPLAVHTDIPALPAISQWVNVKTLGVAGDGGTDDTAALQKAIDTHRILYFPMGFYRVRGTLHLKQDSILIGLSPVTTLFVVQDGDANFAGNGEAIPVVESSTGGYEVLTGIGIFTNNAAPRAAGLSWRSGAASFVQDVNFSAGVRPSPLIAPKYLVRTGPPPTNALDMRASQHPSLWVHDRGGGLFRDVWTADTTADVGVRVENTHTAAIAYQISCEHHMHNEVQFHHAANWTLYALQTEEEKPNGAEATPLELIDAKDITFANLFDYRVSRNVLPMPAAVMARDADNIRFANMHNFSMTRLAFDNSIIDEVRRLSVRTRDFTVFALDKNVHAAKPITRPAVFTSPLHTLANGFSNISGMTTDEHGTLYFTDAAMHRIYRWDEVANKPVLITEAVETPMSMGYAGKGNLLVVDYSKAVYNVTTRGEVNKLKPEQPRANTSLMLPAGFHNDMSSVQKIVSREGVVYAPRSNMAITARTERELRDFFYAPGTDVAVMAGGSWKGTLQAAQLASFSIGTSGLAVSEEDDKVYRVTLNSLQQLSAQTFVPRSGTSVVEDADGNVYVAGAQVFVYAKDRSARGVLETPERPGSLAFGGPEHKTLYIGARGSLYSVAITERGR
jgi:hypothetical protein